MAETPIKKFSAGAVSAAVWENPSTNGEGSFQTVTLQKAYKDKQGDWKHSASFKASDLPKAMLVLNKAYEFVSLNETSG